LLRVDDTYPQAPELPGLNGQLAHYRRCHSGQDGDKTTRATYVDHGAG
jgi:hypothetical protein